MYYTKGNPFNYRKFGNEIFNRSISDFLGADTTLNLPASNIVEESDRYILELAAPGLEKENFKITLGKNYITISADTEEVKNENGEEGKFTRREYNYRKFKRSFMLPKMVNKEEISASYANGILAVTLLKKEEAKEKDPVVIEIK